MNRFGLVYVAGFLTICAAAQSACAQAPKGRQGFVAGTPERSVSLGGGATPSGGGAALTPRTPVSSGGLLSNKPRTPSNVSATAPRTSPGLTATPPRSKPVTSRQPGAVGPRGVASLLNDAAVAIGNNAGGAAPRTGGRLARSSPGQRVERVDRIDRDAGPLGGRSERLFGRGRSRDDDGDGDSPGDSSTDSSNDSFGNDGDSQPTSAAVAQNEAPASVPPPPAPERQSTPASQPATQPGESLADQLARAYFRDVLRFPGYNPLNNPAWRPDVEKTPPSLRDPSEDEAGQGKSAGESLGDRLARENLRHMLNYLEAHQRNQKQFLKRIKEIDPNDSMTLTAQQRQALLTSALDFYSRELRDLDALDEGAIGLSDSVKELRAKRRADLEKALRYGGFLETAPTKK